jgi:hypothetical protein
MRIDHGAEVAKEHGVERSPEWPRVEKAHLVAHPYCEACGPSMPPGTPVNVHHVLPFHYVAALGRPDLELDDRNLITLCETEHDRPAENHHLLIGHLDDFKSSNLDVMVDSLTTFHMITSSNIKASVVWQSKVANKLRPLGDMTDKDKADFIALTSTLYPKT